MALWWNDTETVKQKYSNDTETAKQKYTDDTKTSKQKYSKENLNHCYFIRHKSVVDCPGIKLGTLR
jgi:hypothetical protein